MLGTRMTPGAFLKRIGDELTRIDPAQVSALSDAIYSVYQAGHFVFVIGNGGSGSNASHFCEDIGKGTLKLPEESYAAYQVAWQYDNLGKVELPKWITANSTQDFRKGSDENKTLGLDNFVRSLAVSSATQLEPKYGRMYLVFIRK